MGGGRGGRKSLSFSLSFLFPCFDFCSLLTSQRELACSPRSSLEDRGEALLPPIFPGARERGREKGTWFWSSPFSSFFSFDDPPSPRPLTATFFPERFAPPNTISESFTTTIPPATRAQHRDTTWGRGENNAAPPLIEPKKDRGGENNTAPRNKNILFSMKNNAPPTTHSPLAPASQHSTLTTPTGPYKLPTRATRRGQEKQERKRERESENRETEMRERRKLSFSSKNLEKKT